jgi:hypothetical protein
MHSPKRLGGILIAMLVAVAALLAPAAPAYADITDGFELHHRDFPTLSYTLGGTYDFARNVDVPGGITWHNRTATVAGVVVDIGNGHTTAYFQAFATTTPIGPRQSRTANDDSSLGKVRAFSFVMGDTNLRGGINTIEITLCWSLDDYCTTTSVDRGSA